ncbi:MAG: hypothetical protein AAGA42_07050 [Actinomycetota bacterium]
MSVMVRLQTVVWLATGLLLGVAATVIVTQAWTVGAAPGDDDATFVPTPGCRLVDTRAGTDNVGPRTAPLGEGDVYEIAVHGSNGQCTGALAIPADAVGVAFNVTAVGATARSNVRIYPGNLSEPPLLSNLNLAPGTPPAPNKVDVQLSPTGTVKVFNFRGSVDVIFDVVGFYTKSSLLELDQRLDNTYTRSEVDDLVAPTPQRVGISGAAFAAASGGTAQHLRSCASNGSNNDGMVGSVPVPVGATITGMSARMFDFSAGLDAELALTVLGSDSKYAEIGSVSSSGFDLFDAPVLETSLPPTLVGPSTTVFFEFKASPTTLLSICAAELFYTLP